MTLRTTAGEVLVHGLDLTVHKGEVLGVIGESGSGKTLSFQAALGMLPQGVHASGYISWDNQQYDLSAKVPFTSWRGIKVGYMWQEPLSALNPVLTIGTQVKEAILQDASKQQVLKLFEKVRLDQPEKIYNAYPHEVSGGQRQRALLAVALANQPALIIADEPTSGLDEVLQEELILLFQELRSAMPGLALVFISHDLKWTAKLATRLAVMQRGRLVDTFSDGQMNQADRHTYTKSLIAAQPLTPGAWHRLPWSEFDGSRKSPDPLKPTASNTQPVLEVEGLSVQYPIKTGWRTQWQPILTNVSFQLKKGECLGVQGPSGTGKSSLARALVRLIPAKTGKVLVNGTDWLPLRETQLRPLRRQMQFIFQDPVAALNPRLPVFEQIKDVLQLRGIWDYQAQVQLAKELMSRVGLDPESALGRYPHAFSGGQRQRIAIARALAADPDILICDEVIAALDRNTQAQVLNLLADLKEQGLSIVFIAHESYAVEFLSDRIATLNKGSMEWV